MFAILHALGLFVVDLFKSRRRLEAENLFLRHQLNIALRRISPRRRRAAHAFSGVSPSSPPLGHSLKRKSLIVTSHVGPKLFAIRLEHRLLRALVDRVFEVGEVTPHVDVLPFRIRADRALAHNRMPFRRGVFHSSRAVGQFDLTQSRKQTIDPTILTYRRSDHQQRNRGV